MHPEQPHMAPQQPVAPQPVSAPLTPIAQIECWYLPEGQFTIFAYRKSNIVIYPGWMLIYRKSDNAEVARIQLTPDLDMRFLFGFVRFAQLNGKKFSFFKLNNLFMTSSMWVYLVFFAGILINLLESIMRFNSGRNIGLQLLGLVIMLAGFGLLMTGWPKAKELIAAAKRAAGIAS
ncbi:MAG TPA: hypothetical protein VM581_01100 [Magnetospirillaceae bacterium]|nr:hypothetical protein [Magnetospirillaceae bacterium]